MKKLALRFAILILSFTQVALAQKSTKEIKGDKYYSFYSFDKAVEKYSQANVLTIEGKRKLADSYRNTGNTIKSEEVYATYVNEATAVADDFYNYASVLKTNGKYDEANKYMDKFKSLSPNDLRAKNYAANNAQLTNLLKDEGKYKIEHLTINSDQQDFGTSYYNGKIVFASSRGGSQSIKRSYNWNQKPFLDLYVADAVSNQLKDPTNLNKKINNKLHEGPASFNSEGTFMAFTKNNYAGKSTDDVVKLQIFFSSLKNGKWSKEEPFKLNNAEYSVGHPCLTADGNIMYFASDMPGGFGGADLYRIQKDATGVWGNPENLGDKVNTEGNEMFPFFQEDNEILFFASNGHMGLGGLDMFVTSVKGTGFGKVLNAGAPMNTQSDDFALIIDSKMKMGYFSSNRLGGSGDDDIYSFELLSPYVFGKTIKGIAKDKMGNVLPATIVKLMDDAGKEVATVTTSTDGTYAFTVDADKVFKLNGTKDKYFDGNNTTSTAVKEDVIIADVVLEKDPGMALRMLVTDGKTKQPLEGVKYKITDLKTGEVFMESATSASGDALKPLVEKRLNDALAYKIELVKEGYFPKTVNYNSKIDKPGIVNVHEALDLSMDKEVKDLRDLVFINDIRFDLNKFNIRPDASAELDKVVEIMNKYPEMVIELGAHTDCRATKKYNETLSDKRAKASAAYIKSKITNPARIYGKGYGEAILLNGCECEGAVKSNCTEEEHQKNRRTEFKIISMGAGAEKVDVKNNSTKSFDKKK
jgi:outer membrane protein OmpA-like peptidoglycan-associated protein/Tfp pilus assembly major pilin PilA